MVVFLIGFMGSGKSTIGRALAAKLGWKFIDMDAEIEKQCAMTVAEIFDTHGEPFFRKKEREVLEQLAGSDKIIVATGGGVAVQEGNMEIMNKAGLTIYLMLTPRNLLKRVERSPDKRPLVRGKSSEELLAFIEERLPEREEYYRRAKATIDCDGAGMEYLLQHAENLIINYDTIF